MNDNNENLNNNNLNQPTSPSPSAQPSTTTTTNNNSNNTTISTTTNNQQQLTSQQLNTLFLNQAFNQILNMDNQQQQNELRQAIASSVPLFEYNDPQTNQRYLVDPAAMFLRMQQQQQLQQQQQQQQQQRQFNPHPHAHTHTHSHNADQQHNHHHQQPQQAAHYQQANEQTDSSDIVLNLMNNIDQEQQEQMQQQQQQAQNSSIFRLLLMSLHTNIPILLIVIAKVFHQHLIGFFIILAFLATLHWSNKCHVKQVELKDKKNNVRLLLLILFIFGNLILFFYSFSDYKVENYFVFIKTNIKHMDIWNLLWLVICCDLITKLIIICLKSSITLLPFSFIQLRKRGAYYSLIEIIGSLYRSLIPIHPWILFLLETSNDTNIKDAANDGTGAGLAQTLTSSTSSSSSSIFPVILCVSYILFKLNALYNCYLELSQVLMDLIRNQSFGIPVGKLDIEDSAVCPICQDKFTHPVRLKCKHVFCEDCVCVWLDREQTCPMCRAKVCAKKPTFKDGSTGFIIQWY